MSTYKPGEAQGTLFVEGVSKLDCAFFDPSSGIVGHSWFVDVELTGVLNEQGFVYDFSQLKSLVRSVMKDSMDHALVIPVKSQAVDFSESGDGESWRLHAQCSLSGTNFVWSYQCPRGAVYPIRSVILRRSLIEQEISRLLRHRLPDSVSEVQIGLRKESSEPTAAFFRYTHGITQHQGLCQRLFHGHRSSVEVHIGKERRADLEHFVTRELFNQEVHIATPHQVTSKNCPQAGKRGKSGEQIELSYESSFGRYSATLPADKVFIVEHETSIENLANQVASALRERESTREPISVKIYEGIDKGAIAVR